MEIRGGDRRLGQMARGIVIVLPSRLDLLRLWHRRIEAWMLEQAGIDFAQVQEERTLQAGA
jgi:hypothetical protein